MDDSRVYRLLTPAAWAAAARDGRITPSASDERDGFIHLCARAQILSTAAAHFADEPNLMAAAIRVDALADGLRWEVSRGGAAFPHYYGGAIPLDAVEDVAPAAVAGAAPGAETTV